MKAWRYLIALARPAARGLRRLGGKLIDATIQDPTPEQLRAALIGGAVATPSGANVSLRGVLEKGSYP